MKEVLIKERRATTRMGSFSPYRTGGYSFYFDGTDDEIAVPDSDDFNMTSGNGDFTIECWLYVTGSESIKGLIAKRTTGGAANTNFVIYVDGLKLRSWFSDGSSYFINDWTTSSDLNANSWNHVAIVRNGTTFTAYANGTQMGSRTNVSNTIDSSSRPLFIGCDHPGNVDLNGYISNPVSYTHLTLPTKRIV